MKKLIMIVALLIINLRINAQDKTLNFLKENYEPRKCYKAAHLEILEDSIKEKIDTIYFEIVKPLFQSNISTIRALIKASIKFEHFKDYDS